MVPATAGWGRQSSPQLAIKGHSGSHLAVAQTEAGAVVVKTAGDGPQADRLRGQIAKQRRARVENRLPFVRIPAIVDEGDVEGRYAATMEYVFFQDPIEHFNGVSTVGLRRIVEMLGGYVESEIERSRTGPVPTDVIVAKLDDIEAALHERGTIDRYGPALAAARGRLDGVTTLDLPVGPCHGDLTFSNVLFAHDSTAIALVDFLDSFLDSPLIDLAKLRQDTRFGWTMLMAEGDVDRVRFRQIMTHLDHALGERFAGRPWYDDHLDLLTAVGLLRIAPYVTDADIDRFLVSALATIRL